MIIKRTLIKRTFDFSAALLGIIILAPIICCIAILIYADSRGTIFYKQTRVGRNNIDFKLIKFRTMKPDSDKKGLLTVGNRDSRITRIGYYLRKYKIDELPQLFNVLKGEMSLVGPRPEVRKYVDLYSEQQKYILTVRPGITDYASIEYFAENEILAKSIDPEKTYIQEIMPHKIHLNLKYINKHNIFTDIKILAMTVKKIVS